MKMKKLEIKHIPLIIAAVLVIVSLIFYNNIAIMGNLVLLAVIIGTIPYALFAYAGYKKIGSMEDQLPTFLLDLAEAQKIGMTLPEALKQVSGTDYGKLSEEVKKMNDQLSWGISVQNVMDNFAKRMQKSQMIGRVARIIIEAYNSGGDIGRTMEATAQDITAIKEAEKERKALTSQHTIVMYAIYFIFIGIVIGLSQTLIPMLNLNTQTTGAGGLAGLMVFQDPCLSCLTASNIYCINCSMISILCKMFDLGSGGSCYYNGLFILMAVVQGIFTGLVAGQIGEGSVIAGLKHSMIMTVAGFGTLIVMFKFFV